MNAPNRSKAFGAARRFADAWQETYPKAVASVRHDLDELLTCFQYATLADRKQVRTTNAIERRFREVRRRIRYRLLPPGWKSSRRSMAGRRDSGSSEVRSSPYRAAPGGRCGAFVDRLVTTKPQLIGQARLRGHVGYGLGNAVGDRMPAVGAVSNGLFP